MNLQDRINNNRRDWNKRYSVFIGWCCLPAWGPFEICKDDPSLIGEIKGKIFLEIACGSGHSIKYLLEHGAKKVYALDFSARELNKDAIVSGKAEFIHANMESALALPEKVDTAFSVYGIGWTLDPAAVFANVYAQLKPGGKFVWSWDHSMFAGSKVRDEKICVERSYHDEKEFERLAASTGEKVYCVNRKTSTWFSLLRSAGFSINRYLEPQPLNINEDIAAISSPAMANYYSPFKAERLPCSIVFECFK
jgi:SAM-dependent methyltransferase